jgi:hypothetical protein
MKAHEIGALAYLHLYVDITCPWQLRVGDHEDIAVRVYEFKLTAGCVKR